jgi:hypothetical protein
VGLEIRRTDEILYARHVDGFRLDAVAELEKLDDDLGSYEGLEIIAGGISLPIEEISGLAHFEATGGAEPSY